MKQLHTLMGSRPELLAAAYLCRVAHVHVHAAQECPERQRLLKIGYVCVPDSIECSFGIPFDPTVRQRSFRRSLSRSLDAWSAAGLKLYIHTVASYGLEPLISRLYFPVLVREFYTRGISPYGAHNLDSFRRIATPDTYVATIERDGGVIGGALLKPRAASDALYVRGKAISGMVAEGLMYVLPADFSECKRALLFYLSESFAALGYTQISLGRDLVWVDDRYAGALLEKLRWADRIWLNVRKDSALLFIHGELIDAERGLLVFVLESGRLDMRCYGDGGGSLFACIAKELNAAQLGANRSRPKGCMKGRAEGFSGASGYSGKEQGKILETKKPRDVIYEKLHSDELTAGHPSSASCALDGENND